MFPNPNMMIMKTESKQQQSSCESPSSNKSERYKAFIRDMQNEMQTNNDQNDDDQNVTKQQNNQTICVKLKQPRYKGTGKPVKNIK
ncbi:hypothetical protein BLA29_005414 [Euroglyphus maynei]|uniref:Uncharacterized protein n=1 Tax=Euroglyphus maynei TaxID=6958 RepID=A0A1Y3B2X2_EURMA|nr:hypothetical protein BLA29_005414 [Euroglyphus maynei]